MTYYKYWLSFWLEYFDLMGVLFDKELERIRKAEDCGS